MLESTATPTFINHYAPHGNLCVLFCYVNGIPVYARYGVRAIEVSLAKELNSRRVYMASKHEHGRDRVEKGAPVPRHKHSLRSNPGEHRGKVIGDKTHITGQTKTMGSSEPGRKRGMRGGGQTERNTPAVEEFRAPRFAGVGTRRNPPKGYRGSF